MQILDRIQTGLSQNPFAASFVEGRVKSITRAYPQGYALPDRLLAYAKFRMPGLSGAAEFGRVAYEIVTDHEFVVLLVAYNHATQGFGRDMPDSVAAQRLGQGRLDFPPR